MRSPIVPTAAPGLPSAQLVTSRRNFLVRAFGLTAAGATCTVPIITLADARARVEHHLKGLEQAFRDLYPGVPLKATYNETDPADVLDPMRGSIACALVFAGPHSEWTAAREGWR